MSPSISADERILIVAPAGRDASLAVSTLARAGIAGQPCRNIEELVVELARGAGAAIITEEALTPSAMRILAQSLADQPRWADLPLLIFTSQPSTGTTPRALEQLGSRANITMIERPIRMRTMISATRAAQRARRRQYEIRDLVLELQQRVEERDQFLAMLGHELRNPLAAITLALEGGGDEQALSNERTILVRQTRHLRKLVDDLLDISRVSSGKIVLHRSEVDLLDIVEHCVETLAAQAAGHQLLLQVHSGSEHVTVNGDPVRLEQIVNNLISNAIKYTPAGGKIDVFVEQTNTDVILRVRDNGKGIPPEILGRVFEMFMQGDITIDRAEGGMGIGLSLVRKLVEQHGGDVRACSEGIGAGSEFIVRLPRAMRRAPAPAAASAEKQRQFAPLRIVVVEDNPDVRDLLRIKLRQLGHQVEVAEDGTGGLEKLLAIKPDVALVDIGLPGLSGYEIASSVRREVGDRIYLIALTGYGQASDKEKALTAGFNIHLTKPADFADLQKILGHVHQPSA